MDRVQIKFYTRSGCSLCDENLRVLTNLEDELGFVIEIIDIESSGELERLYGWDVPLATLDGQELFRHRVDIPRVIGIIEQYRSSGLIDVDGSSGCASGC